MHTPENGPELVDGTAVAGVSIPPGTGSFMRPAGRLAPAAPAPAEPAPVTDGETAPEIAQAGPLAAESAPAAVSSASAPALAPGPAMAPTEPTVPTFTAPRTDVRPLAWPLFFGGKLYESIVVKRPSTREVGDYYDRLRQLPASDTKGLRFPIFFHMDGTPVPDAVMDALDDDDAGTVEADIADFLPLRLAVLTKPPAGSTLENGGATAPTSAG